MEVRTYRRTCRRLDVLKRAAIITYERKLAFDKSQKKLYAYVKSKQNINGGITALSSGCKVVTNPAEIASTLNEKFSSVFSKETAAPFSTSGMYSPKTSISSVLFTLEEIEDKLKKLDPFKSMGTDGIHPRVLKECESSFAIPLKAIFELSQHCAEVPNSWRCANVTPIFKSGSRIDPANYRPISLTSVVCRVMESIIQKSIMGHLVSNHQNY